MDEVRHYLSVVRSSWRIVLVTSLVACVAAAAVALLLPRTYESEARLLISQPENKVEVFGTALPELTGQGENAVETQAELLRSRSLFVAVIQRLGLRDTPGSLMRRVKIAPIGQTAVISIVARADSAAKAADIANALGEEYLSRYRNLKHTSLRAAATALEVEVARAQAELQRIDQSATAAGLSASQATERQIAGDRLAALSEKLQQLRVNEQVEASWGVMIDEAVPVPAAVGPTPPVSALLGLLAGALFGVVYVVFQDAREPQVEGLQEAKALLLATPVIELDESATETKPAAASAAGGKKREKQLV